MVGRSVTDILLRNSKLRHQREHRLHDFSCMGGTLAFTDGNVVRPDIAAMAISKPNHSHDNFRSFAISSTNHVDGSFKPTTHGSKSLETEIMS